MNSATESKAYRTIDLVTIATLGVAFGVIYWGWGKVYDGPSEAIGLLWPPAKALAYGPWLMAGVVGGLIVRRPGAAFAAEFIAATVSAIVLGGTQWGWSTLASGIIEGAGAELVFLLVLYRRFNPVVAMLSGAVAGAFEAVYEWSAWIPDWEFVHKLGYLGFFAVSGAVVGLASWFLVRALAAAGVLDSFGAGREAAVEV
jgi:energy-coupling factor transport system substrate-specific component